MDEVRGDPIECSPIGAQYDNWIAAVATTDPEKPQQLGAGGTSPANVYLALMVITFLLWIIVWSFEMKFLYHTFCNYDRFCEKYLSKEVTWVLDIDIDPVIGDIV